MEAAVLGIAVDVVSETGERCSDVFPPPLPSSVLILPFSLFILPKQKTAESHQQHQLWQGQNLRVST